MKKIIFLFVVLVVTSCKKKDYDENLLNEAFLSLNCEKIFSIEKPIHRCNDFNKVVFTKSNNKMVCTNKTMVSFYTTIKANAYLELKETYTFENKINKLFYFQFTDKESVYDWRYLLVKSRASNQSVLLELKHEDFDSNNTISYAFKDNFLFYTKNGKHVVLDFTKDLRNVILLK